MALVEGTNTDRFVDLRDRLEASLANGDDLGASLAVIHHPGELVCDLWGGLASPEKTKPWTRETIVNVWSTTKTMVFLVMLILSDRGELDFDEPVASYWPAFAREGKSEITVQHLMNHTAGLSGFSPDIALTDLADWERCVDDLANMEPWWADRRQSGYHAVTQGYLLGEVVRRVTGTTVGAYFADEVARVLGADFYIGLPESEEPRVSLVVTAEGFGDLPGDRRARFGLARCPHRRSIRSRRPHDGGGRRRSPPRTDTATPVPSRSSSRSSPTTVTPTLTASSAKPRSSASFTP